MRLDMPETCRGWRNIYTKNKLCMNLVFLSATHCDILIVKNALVKVCATSRSAPFGVSFNLRLLQNSADKRGKETAELKRKWNVGQTLRRSLSMENGNSWPEEVAKQKRLLVQF